MMSTPEADGLLQQQGRDLHTGLQLQKTRWTKSGRSPTERTPTTECDVDSHGAPLRSSSGRDLQRGLRLQYPKAAVTEAEAEGSSNRLWRQARSDSTTRGCLKVTRAKATITDYEGVPERVTEANGNHRGQQQQ